MKNLLAARHVYTIQGNKPKPCKSIQVINRIVKVTGHSKIKFFCRVSPISRRLFGLLHVPLNARVSGYLKLKNLSLFALKIYRKYAKRDKLINFKSKLPETRAFKGICYKLKKVLY